MKRICAGVLAILMLLSGCSAVGTEPPAVKAAFSERAFVSYNGEYFPGAAPEGMEFVAQAGYTAMFFSPATAEFVLEDMRTGERYYGISPDANGSLQERSHLLVRDVDPATDSVNTKYSVRANVKAQKTENGFQAWFSFLEEKYAIPVEFTLCEDGLRVRIRSDKIVERGTVSVFSVSLLPFFYAQKGYPEGYIFVPDGSGALIRTDKEKANCSPYNASLYGDVYLTPEDNRPSLTENCLLPFVGMQGATGGFLAMAENGAANGYAEAAVEGQNSGYSHTYFTFDLRRRQKAYIGNAESASAKEVIINETGPITLTDISVRYFLLDSKPENGLAAMAETARNVVADRVGDFSSASDSAMYLSAIGGYTAEEPVLGFRMPLTRTITDFHTATEMVKQLRSEGAERLAMLYTGYNRTSLRGGLSAELTPDPAIGSLKEVNELAKLLGQQHLLLATDTTAFSRNGAGISRTKSTIHDLNKSIITFYPYKRNTLQADRKSGYYLLKTDWAADIARRSADWLKASVPDAGLLIAGFGEKLYGDYSHNGYTREQALQNVRETLREMSKDQPLYIRQAYYDAALYASVIVNAPSSSSGYDVLDEDVPFYQMVFSGTRQIVCTPINCSGNPEQAFLNCVRCGMIPHYEVSAQEEELPGIYGMESFYGASFSGWRQEITARYRQYAPVFEKISGRAFVDYQTVGDGLYQLTYADGVRVIVNMSEKAAQSDGKTVEARSFAVFS